MEMAADAGGQWHNGGNDGSKQWGGGIINPLLLWFNDKILIPTYIYSDPV